MQRCYSWRRLKLFLDWFSKGLKKPLGTILQTDVHSNGFPCLTGPFCHCRAIGIKYRNTLWYAHMSNIQPWATSRNPGGKAKVEFRARWDLMYEQTTSISPQLHHQGLEAKRICKVLHVPEIHTTNCRSQSYIYFIDHLSRNLLKVFLKYRHICIMDILPNEGSISQCLM